MRQGTDLIGNVLEDLNSFRPSAIHIFGPVVHILRTIKVMVGQVCTRVLINPSLILCLKFYGVPT